MRAVIIAISVALASPALGQSISASDIAGQIDSKLAGQSEYRALLDDPDPRRSRAAMQIMMESGDVDLSRMALDFGMTSTDPVVRRLALEAFLNSRPALQVTFDGRGLDGDRHFKSNLSRLGGTVSANGFGFASLRLGEWDEEKSCWLWNGATDCGARLTDAGASITILGSWSQLFLNENGDLQGETNLHNVAQPVAFLIPVAN